MQLSLNLPAQGGFAAVAEPHTPPSATDGQFFPGLVARERGQGNLLFLSQNCRRLLHGPGPKTHERQREGIIWEKWKKSKRINRERRSARVWENHVDCECC